MLNEMKSLKALRGWDRMDSEAKRLLYAQKYKDLPWYKKVFTTTPITSSPLAATDKL
jgi:hypothetical protein